VANQVLAIRLVQSFRWVFKTQERKKGRGGDNERISIDSDVVEVQSEYPDTTRCLRCVDTRKPRDCNDSPILV